MGTYVTTPKITKEKASVHFEVTIENKAKTEKEFKFVTSIVDAKNKEVANATSTEKIGATSISKKTHNLEVKNPNLWDTENPYLYKVLTKIYENKKLVDNYETPLGIRFFSFDAEKGFSLNGKPTKILGVCLHYDNGALGL